MTLPRINSHTNWSRLEEVWLGDCYPAHFYDHLDSQVRDVFYEITEKTQEDLAIIQQKLEEFGVTVVRPQYDRIENYVYAEHHPYSPGQLRKPTITPRDHFLAHGNTLIDGNQDLRPWQHAIDRYQEDSRCSILAHPVVPSLNQALGANTVRVGQDIYLDIIRARTTADRDRQVQEYHRTMGSLFQDYRVHLLSNGGHVDACFAVIKPGLLLTNKYFSDYNRTFPGWDKINVVAPEFAKANHNRPSSPAHNGKFWHAGAGNADHPAFNQHVIQHALDWVGDYTETFFEVNCLVIDEKNVLMMGENDRVFRELEQHGVTAHSLPFRTRRFWDGGLHCLTLDIRRQDHRVDLFPERTQKLYVY
jgi:hypothetical protein